MGRALSCGGLIYVFCIFALSLVTRNLKILFFRRKKELRVVLKLKNINDFKLPIKYVKINNSKKPIIMVVLYVFLNLFTKIFNFFITFYFIIFIFKVTIIVTAVFTVIQLGAEGTGAHTSTFVRILNLE